MTQTEVVPASSTKMEAHGQVVVAININETHALIERIWRIAVPAVGQYIGLLPTQPLQKNQ
jgi:hypothetical protein